MSKVSASLGAIGVLIAVTAGPAMSQAQAPQAPPNRLQPAQKAPRPAQPAPPAPAPNAPAPDQPAARPAPAPGWVSRCASDGRQSALECAIEQTAFLSSTGQLVATVNVRVPSATRHPVMIIQVPLGLLLPSGVNLQIDESKAVQLPLQTCDAKGCYAEMAVPPDMLNAMKSGKRLGISFQSLAKENITVPFVLGNFAEAFQKIQ